MLKNKRRIEMQREIYQIIKNTETGEIYREGIVKVGRERKCQDLQGVGKKTLE